MFTIYGMRKGNKGYKNIDFIVGNVKLLTVILYFRGTRYGKD